MLRQIDKSHISFRSGARGRFAAEFASKVANSGLTEFIEAAILEVAEGALFRGRKWHEYWDEHEGMRRCALWLHVDWNEESHERELVGAHRVFFYDHDKPSRPKITVLWPEIEKLAEHWQKHQHLDPWATGERMATLLTKARVKAPAWGPGE